MSEEFASLTWLAFFARAPYLAHSVIAFLFKVWCFRFMSLFLGGGCLSLHFPVF